MNADWIIRISEEWLKWKEPAVSCGHKNEEQPEFPNITCKTINWHNH